MKYSSFLYTNALIVVVILCIYATIPTNALPNVLQPSPTTLGLHPWVIPRHVKDTTFSCYNSRQTIDISQLNNGICDCQDGTDEPATGACAQSPALSTWTPETNPLLVSTSQLPFNEAQGTLAALSFFCQNVGGKSRSILSSHTNDGVCDCCDGSDEWHYPNLCPNTCLQSQNVPHPSADVLTRVQAFESALSALQVPSTSGTAPRNAVNAHYNSLLQHQYEDLETRFNVDDWLEKDNGKAATESSVAQATNKAKVAAQLNEENATADTNGQQQTPQPAEPTETDLEAEQVAHVLRIRRLASHFIKTLNQTAKQHREERYLALTSNIFDSFQPIRYDDKITHDPDGKPMIRPDHFFSSLETHFPTDVPIDCHIDINEAKQAAYEFCFVHVLRQWALQSLFDRSSGSKFIPLGSQRSIHTPFGELTHNPRYNHKNNHKNNNKKQENVSHQHPLIETKISLLENAPLSALSDTSGALVNSIISRFDVANANTASPAAAASGEISNPVISPLIIELANGPICHNSGSPVRRSTTVTLTCDVSISDPTKLFTVLSIIEPSVCSYEAQVTSPLVCSELNIIREIQDYFALHHAEDSGQPPDASVLATIRSLEQISRRLTKSHHRQQDVARRQLVATSSQIQTFLEPQVTLLLSNLHLSYPNLFPSPHVFIDAERQYSATVTRIINDVHSKMGLPLTEQENRDLLHQQYVIKAQVARDELAAAKAEQHNHDEL